MFWSAATDLSILDRPVTLRARVKEVDGRRITVTCSLYSGDIECATGEVVTVGVESKKMLKLV